MVNGKCALRADGKVEQWKKAKKEAVPKGSRERVSLF